MRLSDEEWKALKELKKQQQTMNAVIKSLIKVFSEKNCITNLETKTEIVLQKDSPKINEVMKILYEINPMLNFGNKTERKAVQRLIDKLGEDKTIATAKAAIAVHGKKFAPSITTPLELERNLSKLVAFYKQNNESKGLIVTDPNV